MRFLIVATAVLACAAAAPSGALLAAPYGIHGASLGYGAPLTVGHGASLGYGAPLAIGHGASLGYAAPLAVGHGASLGYSAGHVAPVAVHAGPALPTISPGDLAGAAIDAHVDANDHARAAVDAHRELHDQASELHGQAANAAEDHAWQSVDAVKTVEAQLDGAAAGAAPILAKQIAGHAAYAAPLAVSHAAPLGLVHGSPLGLAHAAAPYAASKTVVQQSLSQTHPGYVHAAPLVAHAPVAYGAHAGYAHGLAHGW